MSPFGRLYRIARAAVHSAVGRLAYRLGMHNRARRHFERVLLLRGADFAAYVHLGRIAYDHGDYASWRRELEHARRTDPARYSRLKHPVEACEPRLAGTWFDLPPEHDGLEGTDARATWRSPRPFGSGMRRDGNRADGFGRSTDMPLAPDFDPLLPGQQLREGEPREREMQERARTEPPAGTPRDGLPNPDALTPDAFLPDAAMRHDDFGSDAERRRFQLRRPIDRREIARCDIDELARRLSG